MANTIERVKHLECLGLAERAFCTSTRIYNIIRDVGSGNLTADNALHQLVEDYATLHRLGRDIGKLADYLGKQAEISEGEKKGGAE